jgi:predicted esterase
MDQLSVAGDRAPNPRRGELGLVAGGPRVAQLPVVSGPVRLGGRYLGQVYVPSRPGATRLVVLLHGAGGSAESGLRLLLGSAEEHRLILFAPESVGTTWDVIEGGYGPDVVRIQQGLNTILTGLPVADPSLAIGGFSDGASYALSLGLVNGDIVDAVVAFSPGFVAAGGRGGTPACFVSHGRADRVLPIDRCSRTVVAALRRAGCPVQYREFDGGHEIPPPVIDEAMRWLSTVERGS